MGFSLISLPVRTIERGRTAGLRWAQHAIHTLSDWADVKVWGEDAVPGAHDEHGATGERCDLCDRAAIVLDTLTRLAVARIGRQSEAERKMEDLKVRWLRGRPSI